MYTFMYSLNKMYMPYAIGTVGNFMIMYNMYSLNKKIIK